MRSAPATLDDVLVAIRLNTAAVLASTRVIVGSTETARRLNIGTDHLTELVATGQIKRIPHLRGRGNGFCYHVDEITRYATEVANREPLRNVAS